MTSQATITNLLELLYSTRRSFSNLTRSLSNLTLDHSQVKQVSGVYFLSSLYVPISAKGAKRTQMAGHPSIYRPIKKTSCWVLGEYSARSPEKSSDHRRKDTIPQ
jgi:hypothetical protein